MESRTTRLQWVGKLEYLMCSVGYTVGLGNLWRFPHSFYVNGGGVFFIPYTIAVLLCAFPMLFLEMFLGQFASEGAITIWKFCPIFKGIGWAIMFNLFITNIYYVVIVMYSFYYMLVSFVNIGGVLPWQKCPVDAVWRTSKCSENPYVFPPEMTDNEKINQVSKLMDKNCVNMSIAGMSYETFKENFQHCIDYTSPEEEYWNRFVLGVHESTGFDDLGPVVGRNALCLLVVWFFIFYCCLRGIRTIAKVCIHVSSWQVTIIPEQSVGLLLLS